VALESTEDAIEAALLNPEPVFKGLNHRAAGLADHVWTIEELLMMVAVPESDNTK